MTICHLIATVLIREGKEVKPVGSGFSTAVDPSCVRVKRVKLVTLYKPGPRLSCLLIDDNLSRLVLEAITNKQTNTSFALKMNT